MNTVTKNACPLQHDHASVDKKQNILCKKTYTAPQFSIIHIPPTDIEAKGCIIKESCCGLLGS